MSNLSIETSTDDAWKIPSVEGNAISTKGTNTRGATSASQNNEPITYRAYKVVNPIISYALGVCTFLTSYALALGSLLNFDKRLNDFNTWQEANNRGSTIKDFILYRREKPPQDSYGKALDKFTTICAVSLGAEILGCLLWQKVTEKRSDEKKSDSFIGRIEQEKLKSSEISASR